MKSLIFVNNQMQIHKQKTYDTDHHLAYYNLVDANMNNTHLPNEPVLLMELFNICFKFWYFISTKKKK